MKNILFILIISSLFFYSCINSERQSEIQLTEETKQLVSNLEDKIYINIYLNGDLSPQFKKLQSSVNDLISQFQDLSKKEIDFEFVQIKEKDMTKQEGVYNPLVNIDIHPIWVKNNESLHKTYPYAIVHFREKSMPVLLHNSLYYDTIMELDDTELKNSINYLEYNFIESFYLLQQNEKKRIAFLMGNEQLDSTNTWDIRNTLSRFYTVDFFDLRSFEINTSTNEPDIKKQIEKLNQYECLIIAKPNKEFLDIDKLLLDQHIMSGGKTLWLIEGTSANMNNFNGNMSFTLKDNNLSLNELLVHYGATINKDVIADEKCSKSPVYYNNEIAYFNWPYKPTLTTNSNHIIGKLEDSILTDFVSSINIIDKKNSTILIQSSEKTNSIQINDEVSFDIIKNPPITFEGQKTTAVLIEKKFNSAYSYINNNEVKKKSELNKMIIISDGDIISNIHNPPNFYYPLGYYHYGRNVFDGNTNFILNSIQYLCGDEEIIKVLNNTKLNHEK